jgi:hypothetical protein
MQELLYENWVRQKDARVFAFVGYINSSSALGGFAQKLVQSVRVSGRLKIAQQFTAGIGGRKIEVRVSDG